MHRLHEQRDGPTEPVRVSQRAGVVDRPSGRLHALAFVDHDQRRREIEEQVEAPAGVRRTRGLVPMERIAEERDCVLEGEVGERFVTRP